MMLQQALPATIRTERLTLRAPAISDVADMVRHANNPKMVETTATLPFPFAESDGLAFVADAAENEAMQAYAIAGANDDFMGAILFKFVDGKWPEIGYWLGEANWGKGYAAEAVAGLVGATRNVPGFTQIDARVLQSNPASIRVLDKVGFVVIEHTQGVVERHRGKPLLIMRWSAP